MPKEKDFSCKRFRQRGQGKGGSAYELQLLDISARRDDLLQDPAPVLDYVNNIILRDIPPSKSIGFESQNTPYTAGFFFASSDPHLLLYPHVKTSSVSSPKNV